MSAKGIVTKGMINSIAVLCTGILLTGVLVSCGEGVDTANNDNEFIDEVVNVTAVSVDPASVTLVVGEELVVSASMEPSNATNTSFTWNVDDASIATVKDENGTVTVTGVAVGNTKVSATAHNGVKGSMEVNVVDSVVKVEGIGFMHKGSEFSEITVQNNSSYDMNNYVVFTDGAGNVANPQPSDTRLTWNVTKLDGSVTDIASIHPDFGILYTKATNPSQYASNVVLLTATSVADPTKKAYLTLGVGYTIEVPNCILVDQQHIYGVITIRYMNFPSYAYLENFDSSKIIHLTGTHSVAYCSNTPITETLHLVVGLDEYDVTNKNWTKVN